MSFLSAAQSAAIRLVGRHPQAFFGATDPFSLELCDLANDVATDVMKANDWRGLTKLNEITGNGTATAFSLPGDYDRMPVKAGVFRPNWNSWHYASVQDLDQWRDLLNGAPSNSPGSWIILDNQMQIYPAIGASDKAQFYYISKNIVKSAAGAPQAGFSKDDDVFLFDDRLLTLGLIWKWRAQKRLEYAEDMNNYEIALAEITGRDKGARILVEGRPTFAGGAGIAYPWPLGGGI